MWCHNVKLIWDLLILLIFKTWIFEPKFSKFFDTLISYINEKNGISCKTKYYAGRKKTYELKFNT